MKRFKNILAVYSDGPGGDDALVQAISLARANQARLTVASCLEFPGPVGFLEVARRRLCRITPWIVQEGVNEVTTSVLVGTSYIEIVRKVMRDEHDMVIVSAENDRGLRGTFLGSTAINLMRQCPCSVWVLKPSGSAAPSDIMAALSLSLDKSCGDDLNDKILALAKSLALAHDALIHVVHFWDIDGSDGDMLKSEIPRNTKRQILEKHETMRRTALNALLARNSIQQCAYEIHLPRGQPYFHMGSLAARLGIDLVVMGSQGRIGTSGLLRGNFSEAILDVTRSGVLAVKPDEFQTRIVLPLEEMLPNKIRAAAR